MQIVVNIQIYFRPTSIFLATLLIRLIYRLRILVVTDWQTLENTLFTLLWRHSAQRFIVKSLHFKISKAWDFFENTLKLTSNRVPQYFVSTNQMLPDVSAVLLIARFVSLVIPPNTRWRCGVAILILNTRDRCCWFLQNYRQNLPVGVFFDVNIKYFCFESS